MKLRYFVGTIVDHVGERDIETTVFFRCTARSPDDKLDKIAQYWWGAHAPMTTSGYDHGDIYTDAGAAHEISKATFDEMTKFYPIL